MTEEEAQKLWCHHHAGEVRCRASECMAWRWLELPPAPETIRAVEVLIPGSHDGHDAARRVRRPREVPSHWEVIYLGNRYVWRETEGDLARRRKKVPASMAGYCVQLGR